jgi:hypothetical protein
VRPVCSRSLPRVVVVAVELDYDHRHPPVVLVVVVAVVVVVIFDCERFVDVSVHSEQRMIRWDSLFELLVVVVVEEVDHESLPKRTTPFPMLWIESAFVDRTNPIPRVTTLESNGFDFVRVVVVVVAMTVVTAV